jgi:iron(III) transport system substrate-binding protein
MLRLRSFYTDRPSTPSLFKIGMRRWREPVLSFIHQNSMKYFVNPAFVCLLFFYSAVDPVPAAEFKSAEWEQTVEAAKKEGQVTVYHTRGPFEGLFTDFSKRYSGVKVVAVSGRGGDLITRIMAERRGDKYLTDVYIGSTGTPLDVLYPANLLEPIQPLLILPEVKDPSRWLHKQYHYGDPDGKYIFVFEGVVRSDMAFNTTLVDVKEITSYWDLVNPKWRRRIVAMHPNLAGFPTGLLQFAYYHPELGSKFLRRLFGEMEITLARDGRQIVDWIAVGKYAIAIAAPANEVFSAMKQGLPLGRFEPRAFKEGVYMRPTQGSLSVLTRNSHPNATKVFINWLLSVEGQTLYQKHFMRGDPVFSLRQDVPPDPSIESYKPKAGDKFISVYRPEFRDLDNAKKVIEEALKKN